MAARSSQDIREMQKRGISSLRALDWFRSEANKDLDLRWKANEFVLKRLFPERQILQGDSENPISIQVYIPEVNAK